MAVVSGGGACRAAVGAWRVHDWRFGRCGMAVELWGTAGRMVTAEGGGGGTTSCLGGRTGVVACG